MGPFTRQRGGVRVKLPEREVAILLEVAWGLRGAIQARPPESRRLFPPAYPDDDSAQAEFEDLTRDELVSSKLAGIDVFEKTLSSGKTKRGMWSALLDEDQTGAWLGFLNDSRLALGTRLDVSEGTYESEISPDDPQAAAHTVYRYLGWLEGFLVETMLG